MRKVKVLGFLACLLVSVLQSAAEVKWVTDMNEAKNQAKAEGKSLLLNFTGSDWCRYCVLNEKEVLASEVFTAFAEKNLVCVKLDFPRKKELPEGLKKQNQAIQEKYKVGGFPTYIVVDPEGGEKLRETGFIKTHQRFVESLDQAVNPEKYQDEKWEVLANKDFDKDLTKAFERAQKEGKMVLHFVDNSRFSSMGPRVNKAFMQSPTFRKEISKHCIVVHTVASSMFPPIQEMKKDPKKWQGFMKFVTEHNRAEATWPKLCYSDAEFALRTMIGTRDELPAMVLSDAKGKVVKVLNRTKLPTEQVDCVGSLLSLLELEDQ